MPLTVKEKIEERIANSPDVAFIRREFDSIGSYRQVSRAVSVLIDEGKLMRAGSGILVRAKRARSRLKRNFGQMVTFPATDAVGVAMEVLPKLGYAVRLGSKEEERLTGQSTQVPTFGIVRVDAPPKRRPTRRKIDVNGEVLRYEKSRSRG